MKRENINKLILDYHSYANRAINLIASENYPNLSTRKALSSLLMGKYAEGYPGKRFYAGNMIVDKIEEETQLLAQDVFNTNYFVNVQAHSGSIANQAIVNSIKDTKPIKILSLNLSDGGHLSHGSSVSITGKKNKIYHYFVNKKTNKLNYEQILSIAKKTKPDLVICGFTSYPFEINFNQFSKIANAVNALLLADISHIAALIIAGAQPSPFRLADFVMTTTHKSLAGPRGALIFCKNEELSKKINKAVFPLLQGGPHMHSIAGIGVALKESKKSSFVHYASSIVENNKAICSILNNQKISYFGGENHLTLINTQKSFGINGQEAQSLLEQINILVNKNSFAGDISAVNPSGIRIGTPAMTKRGMKIEDMEETTKLLIEALHNKNQNVMNLRGRVISLAQRFPIG